jgi:ATP-dependent DNA helicase RecQ
MLAQTSPSSAVQTKLLDVMRRYWGYDAFLPLQARAMAAAMTDRDSVVVLPTGGGKSLCFQAPAVCREGLALVVSPLISLMKDQVDALRACGVPAAAINSTLAAGERRIVAEQIRRGELKLAYIAPERLLSGRTLEFFKQTPLSLIAIDEAHCISQWGHDFRPEYRGLRILKETFPRVGVHAYTATASEIVQRDIAQQLGLVNPQIMVGSFDRPNLVYRVRRSSNRFAEVCQLVERRRGEAGIVYCISRKEVDKTAEALSSLGYRARPITPVSPTASGIEIRMHFSKSGPTSSSPPWPSAWESTNRMCATSFMPVCRSRWSITCRRAVARVAMGWKPIACSCTAVATRWCGGI